MIASSSGADIGHLSRLGEGPADVVRRVRRYVHMLSGRHQDDMFSGVRLPEFRELQGYPTELLSARRLCYRARATAALAHPHTGGEPALNAGISYATAAAPDAASAG